MRKFRTAIVGCGRISRIHIAALKALRDVEIVALCDLDEKAARSQALESGIPKFFTDMETMMKEVAPDVVHLLTPPVTHLPLIRIAARYKAHVYCEKPLASTGSDAREIREIAGGAGISVCPGHSLLFEPAFVQACRRVHDGGIGRVISVRAEQGFTYEAAARSAKMPWSYTYDWGIFDNNMPHPLYLASHFLKEPGSPKVVGFNLDRVREACVEEIRVLIPSEGAVGEVTLSLCSSPAVCRVEIVGTQGRILVDFTTRTVLCSRRSGLPGVLERFTANFSTAMKLANAGTAVLFRIATGRTKSYMGIRRLVAEFYRALRAVSEAPVKLADGVLTAEQMEEIKKACAAVAKQRVTSRVEESSTARILVTGATGFLGGRLLERLSRDRIPVRATARLLSRARPVPGVQWIKCDLGNVDEVRQALCGVETVFHCAGMLAPGSLEDYQNTNVKMTLALASAAADAGVKNFIYVSSLSVYGEPRRSKAPFMDENAPHDPRAKDRGFYTQTKVEAEKALLSFVARQSGNRDSLRVVILRPGSIYGPGAKLPVGRFPLPSPSRLPIVTGSPRIPMPLVYVENVIDAMLAAAQASVASGSVYNLVDSPEIDQGTVSKTLLNLSGGRVRPIFIPYGLVWVMMLAFDGLTLLRRGRLGTARFRLKRTLANMRFDCNAAKNDLGWEPRVSLNEGLSRTILALAETLRIPQPDVKNQELFSTLQDETSGRRSISDSRGGQRDTENTAARPNGGKRRASFS